MDVFTEKIKYFIYKNMVREKAINLYSEYEGLEQADELVQALNARKRGKYNTKLKVIEYSPYNHMNKLYQELNNWLSDPIMQWGDEPIDYNGITQWYSNEHVETYEYEGIEYTETFPRECLAEITGTENFNITDRIMLHEKLIKLLQERVELKNAVKLVQPDVKELQKKYEIKEFTLWLKKQRSN